MKPVFTIPDEQFAACAGFDALLYVRTLRMFLSMTLYITLVVCIVVLPVNWTSSAVDRELRAQESDPRFAGCADAELSGDPEDMIAVRHREFWCRFIISSRCKIAQMPNSLAIRRT